MELWAFGTSPYGLGLDNVSFWGLTHAQFYALRRQWKFSREFQARMFFQIRADIHNGWMPREDKQPWTIEDFNGEQKDPRERKMTKEQARRYFQSRFFSKTKDGKKDSAISKLKGQPLPIPIDRKVG